MVLGGVPLVQEALLLVLYWVLWSPAPESLADTEILHNDVLIQFVPQELESESVGTVVST